MVDGRGQAGRDARGHVFHERRVLQDQPLAGADVAGGLERVPDRGERIVDLGGNGRGDGPGILRRAFALGLGLALVAVFAFVAVAVAVFAPRRGGGHWLLRRAHRSAPRVRALVRLEQAGTRNVGVALRRGDAAMSEEFLHGADIRPSFKQVRRKRVAKRMRPDPPSRQQTPSIPIDHRPDVAGGHRFAFAVQEHRAGTRPPPAQGGPA